MEVGSQSVEKLYCLGCLITSQDCKLQEYKIQYTHLWTLLEVSSIKLCHLCYCMARRAELFIQNVQSNQILLQNYIGDLSTNIFEARTKLQLPISLSHSHLDPISLTNKDYANINSKGKGNMNFKVTGIEPKVTASRTEKDSSTKNIEETIDKANFKVELKVETDQIENTDEEFESHDYLEPQVKEEDDYPLTVLKNVLRCGRVGKKSTKVKQGSKALRKPIKKTMRNIDSLGIKKIIITKEECMEERKRQALDPAYVNCSFKCQDCIKGFNFKAAYDTHIKKHDETMGELVCYICQLRTHSEEKLVNHTKCHTIRWKCTLCGLVRSNRSTMLDHHNVVHKGGERQLSCPYCPKTFKRQMSRRRHVKYKHLEQERVTCTYCEKSYANKEGLKAHMMTMHPTEVSASEHVKKYPCEECGMMFRSPTYVKIHSSKHSLNRDYYCIECDKGFKSERGLKQHLKTTQIHVTYSELPISCSQCEKRFSKRRELERHMNSVHLDRRPFKCDHCEKAYTSSCSLRDHRRVAHEGYKRPLRYDCKFCDKIFASSSILKAHIRTHTGERPYQCDQCPAQFTQSGALATHNKLIHQRLTRDGKPK